MSREPWREHANAVAVARYNRRIEYIHTHFGPGGDKYIPGDYVTVPALRFNAALDLMSGRYHPRPPSWWWRVLHPRASWPLT